MRLLLYAHVLLGLGHVARALAIARAASRLGAECAVLASGLAVRPSRVDAELLHLPPDDGDFTSRRRLVLETVQAFRPDKVLVDHVALGLRGELLEALLESSCAWVWGLPYAAPAGTPRNPRIREALGRYQAAVAYTDPGWCDPFPPMSGQLPAERFHAGVIAHPPARSRAGDTVVALAGAGAGGRELFSWLRAALRGRARLRVVLGPLSDCADWTSDEEVEIVSESAAQDALEGARLVVARAGYNTAYALAQTDLPVVLAPLSTPESGSEQLERARALAGLPGIWCLEQLGPGVLDQALSWTGRRELPFRVDGAERAARYLVA